MPMVNMDVIRPLLVEAAVLEITRRHLQEDTTDPLAFADYHRRLAANQRRMQALADQLHLRMENVAESQTSGSHIPAVGG